jgi:glutathione S-transferase
MRLYMRPTAPNAVKVLVFAAEIGVVLDAVDVGTLPAQEMGRVLPLGTVPVLVTDSGLVLSESLTICEYLDQAGDGPSLFGNGLEERALIAQWERRAELMLLNPAIEYGHHSHPMFAGKTRQFPEWAREHVKASAKMIQLMEAELREHEFLAGQRFTIADLTAFLGYSALAAFGALSVPTGPSVGAWLSRVGSRPSFAPLQALAALV